MNVLFAKGRFPLFVTASHGQLTAHKGGFYLQPPPADRCSRMRRRVTERLVVMNATRTRGHAQQQISAVGRVVMCFGALI